MSGVQDLLRDLNIDQSQFTEEELRILQRGGIGGDTDDEDNMRDSQELKSLKRQQNQNREENLRNQTLISGLQGKIKILEQEVNRVKTQSDNEKRVLIQDNNRQNEKMQNELRQLRARHVHVEGQVPLIKEALNQVRDMLTGLVPENVYLKLRDLPEKDLPPSEWILVNVWELVYPFKKEAELQKKELFRLRDELKQQVDKQNHILGELEHANRLLYDKDDDYKRHQLNYENARKGLEVELTRAHEELEILREKGSNYDELMRKFKQIEQEKFLLEEKIGFYDSEAGKEGKHVLSEVYKTTDDMRRKTELLNQDKEYLTKENIELLEKNKRLEDRVDKLENELIDAKNQAQEYLFKLLNHKTETVADYEKRVSKEMNELRDKFERDLKESKENMMENYEMKCRILSDAKEELEMKLDNSEAVTKEKERAYQNLMVDNRQLQKQVNSDLAEMRISYRIKSEELERISNMYQESNDTLKTTKYENEMLREKMNILKAEYYKAEGQGKQDQANLRAENAVLKERLKEYELIEKEVDEAVEGLARSDGDPNDTRNPYLIQINNAPTSTKRRVQQCLQLSRDLKDSMNRNHALKRELEDVKKQLQVSEDKIRINEELLTKTNQPYTMLLSQIEDKEKELLRFRNTLKQERGDYDELKEEYEQLRKAHDRVNEDVKRLLIRKQNIANIQALLIKLAKSDKTEVHSNVNNIINEISEILQNKAAIGGQPTFMGGTLKKYDGSSYNIPERDQEQIQLDDSQGPGWYHKLQSKRKR